MDPDPYSEYGSRKLLNTDPIRIQIHNTGFKAVSKPEPIFWSVRAESWLRLLLNLLGKLKRKGHALVICKHEVSSIYKDKYDPKMNFINNR